MTQEQEREAVLLLAELLMDAAARKRRGSASPSGFGSVIGGASDVVAALPNEGVSARRAA